MYPMSVVNLGEYANSGFILSGRAAGKGEEECFCFDRTGWDGRGYMDVVDFSLGASFAFTQATDQCLCGCWVVARGGVDDHCQTQVQYLWPLDCGIAFTILS